MKGALKCSVRAEENKIRLLVNLSTRPILEINWEKKYAFWPTVNRLFAKKQIFVQKLLFSSFLQDIIVNKNLSHSQKHVRDPYLYIRPR